MGEMADFFLEQVEEDEEDRYLYRSGVMAIQDAYDLGIIDELGFECGSGNHGANNPYPGRCGLDWHKANDERTEWVMQKLGAAINKLASMKRA